VSKIAKVKAQAAEQLAKSRARYASIRESEQGRMVTDSGIAFGAGLGCSFANGAYPDASFDVMGMTIPYTAAAGAAALIAGKQTGNRELAAGGYGALFSFGCDLAKQAGSDWGGF